MVDRLDDAAVAAALPGLHWRREGDALVKSVRRVGFAGALAYVNEVGAVAEAHDHHPDIAISWDTVSLTLYTHTVGGLTDLDLALARALDSLDDVP